MSVGFALLKPMDGELNCNIERVDAFYIREDELICYYKEETFVFYLGEPVCT